VNTIINIIKLAKKLAFFRVCSLSAIHTFYQKVSDKITDDAKAKFNEKSD